MKITREDWGWCVQTDTIYAGKQFLVHIEGTAHWYGVPAALWRTWKAVRAFRKRAVR